MDRSWRLRVGTRLVRAGGKLSGHAEERAGQSGDGARDFRAPWQTCSSYFDCASLWSALWVSYITGLAAITKNKTQKKSGLNNTEIHFSLP